MQKENKTAWLYRDLAYEFLVDLAVDYSQKCVQIRWKKQLLVR
jgi:hypothetical protein